MNRCLVDIFPTQHQPRVACRHEDSKPCHTTPTYALADFDQRGFLTTRQPIAQKLAPLPMDVHTTSTVMLDDHSWNTSSTLPQNKTTGCSSKSTCQVPSGTTATSVTSPACGCRTATAAARWRAGASGAQRRPSRASRASAAAKGVTFQGDEKRRERWKKGSWGLEMGWVMIYIFWADYMIL